ncbi:MAG: 50S ribosomal protein L35 [Clostridiales bacterium]|nr:50S ribosomal protein L35 [Clostridiales bacterium]HBM80711.1 50S ribosomal protein L35 [Clostridiaceae bacterium]
MPKIKTNRAAAKRYRLTGSGKIKRGKAFKSHFLSRKSAKRKRNLRKIGYISENEARTVKRLIPYK